MQIDRSTLDRLVTLGRTKGHLTNEDLQAALPVDSMGADDIALVVVHLEEAGIPVELDESLLTSQPSKPPTETHAFEILSPEKPVDSPSLERPDLSSLDIQPSLLSNVHGSENQAASGAHKAIILAGIAVLALFALALLLVGS